MRVLDNNQKGFTIVELMIATVVFSMVLLICSLAILHIGRVYYRGTIINRTQDVARKITDDISNAIQFGDNDDFRTGTSTVGAGARAYCIGRNRYSYNTDRMRGDGGDPNELNHILWRDVQHVGADCNPVNLTLNEPSPSTGNISFGMELLGDNMRLPEFIVAKDPATDLWTVSVTVSYGEPGDFQDPPIYKACKGPDAGGQFCAVSSYTIKVKGRL